MVCEASVLLLVERGGVRISQRKHVNFTVHILFVTLRACFHRHHHHRRRRRRRRHQDENTVIVFCVRVGCLVPNFRSFHLLVSFPLKPL